MRGSRLHRLSILRFVPEWYLAPRVLIHLLSLIFRRQDSCFQSWSITMTLMSACECATSLKCSTTGDSLSSLMPDVVSVVTDSTVEFSLRLTYVLLENLHIVEKPTYCWKTSTVATLSSNLLHFGQLKKSLSGHRVYLKDSQIGTDLHVKPTDRHQFLQVDSYHPKHCKAAIPYSQVLCLQQICSEGEDFGKRVHDLKKLPSKMRIHV